jgi:hypothetical protein
MSIQGRIIFFTNRITVVLECAYDNMGTEGFSMTILLILFHLLAPIPSIAGHTHPSPTEEGP